jgi:hypothetical protein
VGRVREEIVHLTPSAHDAIVTSRIDWGWRPGLPVLLTRCPETFAFGVPDRAGEPITEFTSRGLRLAVRSAEIAYFQGAVLSCNYDALYGTDIWWLSNPNRVDVSPNSDPLGATCCSEKFRRFHPELFGVRGWLGRILGGVSADDRDQLIARTSDFLWFGDSRAAVVLRIKPLIVAAYCDEMDAVILLGFPAYLAEGHLLDEKSRLVTTNLHRPLEDGPLARDIHPGPRTSGSFGNVRPIVADFLAAEPELVEARRRAIAASEYERCWEFGERGLRDGQPIRSGRPLEAGKPGPPWGTASG